jgi:Bacterial mobilisation protein (MobC)
MADLIVHESKPKRAWRTPGTRPVTLRPTDAEHADLTARAADEGMSLSGYLIWAGSRDAPPLSLQDRKILVATREELRRIGVNLNQLAHATNAAKRGNGQAPTAAEIAGTLASLNELMAAIKALL